MEKAKELAKNILYISVVVFCIIILVFIIIIIIKNIRYFFNIGEAISSVINQTNDEGTINILSLNLAILQGLTGIIGLGIVVAAYFNFTTIREKLKEIDKKLVEHEEKMKEYKMPNEKDIIKEKQEED